MKCLMDKSREVSYPCSHACPLFGDCMVAFGEELHSKMEAAAVSEPMTNGDRVRTMCDGELAELFAAKVIDQVALMAVESGRQIGGTQLAAMKEAYARTFFSWLRSPAEEEK